MILFAALLLLTTVSCHAMEQQATFAERFAHEDLHPKEFKKLWQSYVKKDGLFKVSAKPSTSLFFEEKDFFNAPSPENSGHHTKKRKRPCTGLMSQNDPESYPAEDCETCIKKIETRDTGKMRDHWYFAHQKFFCNYGDCERNKKDHERTFLGMMKFNQHKKSDHKKDPWKKILHCHKVIGCSFETKNQVVLDKHHYIEHGKKQ